MGCVRREPGVSEVLSSFLPSVVFGEGGREKEGGSGRLVNDCFDAADGVVCCGVKFSCTIR